MIFGYGRVSTRDQNLNLQKDALTGAGCERLYLEKITGTKKERPELNKLREQLRPGDTVVVWKLDRLGRSLPDLIELMEEFRSKQITFRCLALSMDTGTAEGRLIYNIFASLAEFVRDTIVENTNAGLKAARSRGKVGGRPKGLSPRAREKAKMAALLYKDQNPVDKIIGMVGIKSKATLYAYLRHEGIKLATDENVMPV
ncbi:site-specific DNA recombinase [Spirosoma luteolum]